MKWPWVSRAVLEAVAGAAHAQLTDLQAREAQLSLRLGEALTALEAERAYSRNLAERALQMREKGFEPPPPPPPPPEEPLPDAVEAAIGERAINPELERHLRTWARQALTVSEPQAVAQRILKGDEETVEP